jgi:hypothetical protein
MYSAILSISSILLLIETGVCHDMRHFGVDPPASINEWRLEKDKMAAYTRLTLLDSFMAQNIIYFYYDKAFSKFKQTSGNWTMTFYETPVSTNS